MDNPFRYGEVVTGSDFADRREEQKETLQELRNNGRIFLISPRRYGKTSLIINVLDKLRKEGFYTAYIDLYRASSLHQFLELLARAVTTAAETRLERLVKMTKELLPGIRPKIDFSPDGTPSLTLDYTVGEKDTEKLMQEVFDAAETLALKNKRKFVVAFDEFQEIRTFDGDKIEKAMRASFQQHHNTAYLFAGSKRHLLFDMVGNSSRAFYKMGKVMNLQKIPRDEFLPFLLQRFKKTNFLLEKGVLEKVMDLSEDYPYNVQFICHELWNHLLDQKKVKIDDVETILERILSHQNPTYLSLWDSLSLHQRRVLSAVATYGGRNVFSQDFISSNKLGALSSVQTSIRLLIKKELLDKEGEEHIITDVFYKEWIKRKMN